MALVTITASGPVARITLDRAPKLNAQTPQMLADLIDAAHAVDAMEEVKVAIVAGIADDIAASLHAIIRRADRGRRLRECDALGGQLPQPRMEARG